MQTYEVKENIINSTSNGVFNEYYEIKTVRYFKNGNWYINKKIDKEDKIEKNYDVCESFIHPSINEWNNAIDILSQIQDANIKVKKVSRKISFEDSISCVEEKIMNYIEYENEKFAFIGNLSDIKSAVGLLNELSSVQKISGIERVWPIDRTYVILDPEATANLFHQLMNFIKGDNPKLKLGERIFSEDISIFDNPRNPYLIGSQVFDDEGVKTRKKQVISDGTVTEYLGTLTSKYGNPGNARGILPHPDYFNLEVKPGDWNFKELLDDTKFGLLVLGSTRSEIIKNSIRRFPKNALLLNSGRIFVREIAITLQDLITIDAISKDMKSAYIDELHGAITPFIRLKAKPIIY
ncbi:metallopeptidase TldD-related protein [Acidianus manzaensis]|uniref:Metalloprotease TldD/E C-terminal domain-containing protein n=1 Tax=Acidianus manzaensis TaxID=282676 RepID=A0A1W6K0H0_9CREN|nr:metallopeptidase TldD-related protein [Acidianus manzaensis]ARM76071.1 hypothetical protein B6F84_08580 [Acidianus manzaensis]